MTRYAHIARAVLSRPWAIKKDSVEWAAITEILSSRLAGERFSEDEIEQRLAAVPRRQVSAPSSAGEDRYVSVIPIHGVLMPRASLMSEMSGGQSVAQLSAAFNEAVTDDRAVAIVLDVDSPGGMVDGIPEFAAQIRAARGTKPIVAIADTIAASAAYWLAVQADEVSVTPSGEVGSIGVFSEHESWAKFWETTGVEHTYISAGKYKTEANEYEPLSEDAQAHIQAIVDDYYGMFVNDVAKGRGVKASEVRSGYGQGRVLTASMARAAGMVDRIETLGAVLDRLSRSSGRRQGRSALADVGGVTVAIDEVTETFTQTVEVEVEDVVQDTAPAAAFEVELERIRAERHRRSRA
jgi:signal peptide peptidase SppA